MKDIDTVILDSIWARCLWDFLMQNPQLEEWLDGSKLQPIDGSPLSASAYRLLVKDVDHVQWLSVHLFAIKRSLYMEMKRPVAVKVEARPGGSRQ